MKLASTKFPSVLRRKRRSGKTPLAESIVTRMGGHRIFCVTSWRATTACHGPDFVGPIGPPAIIESTSPHLLGQEKPNHSYAAYATVFAWPFAPAVADSCSLTASGTFSSTILLAIAKFPRLHASRNGVLVLPGQSNKSHRERVRHGRICENFLPHRPCRMFRWC